MSPEIEQLIPIMLCFNNNYSIPGIVAVHSMLKHASKDYQYNIHILHSDISARNQRRLQRVVGKFPNARLFFHNMENRFEDVFEKVGLQAYWSKEIFYKCITPSFFPQYERIVITDADVVFCDDFTKHWKLFENDDESLLAGYRCLLKKSDSDSEFIKMIYKGWDVEERRKCLTCAGFWFQNLKLMRQENIEQRFLEFIQSHLDILRQPEQQVVNVVCHPRIKLLPPEGMIMGYDYQTYKTEEDFHNDKTYSAEEVKYALEHPIQLHYAGGAKPWNAGFVSKSSLWWKDLFRLGSLGIILEQLWRFVCGSGYLKVFRNSIRRSIAHSMFMKMCYRLYRKCGFGHSSD